MFKRRFFFYIDVLGVCNLSCPSCPTGNMKAPERQKGLMEPELLDRILTKATSECKVKGVGLFNWTEPLLHPRLPELVRIVKRHGIKCKLSTNLNIMKNVDAVLAEHPESLRISLSGFTQEVYGYTHRDGDIEKVKENMAALAEAKKRVKSRTKIHVFYHRYKNNLEDEPRMREYAESLGFEFKAAWAMMMPLEKVLAYAGESTESVPLSREDHQLIENLALPLGKALEASKRLNDPACKLQDEQMTLDHRGNVALCCTVYLGKHTLGSYLDLKVDELQKLKYQQDICKKCMGCGAHSYAAYSSPELDRIATENLDPKYANLSGLKANVVRKHLKRGLKRVKRIFRGSSN